MAATLSTTNWAVNIWTIGSNNYVFDIIQDPTTNASGNHVSFPNFGTPFYTSGLPITITNASNAAPIVITAASHGLATNDVVLISGVLGNLSANGLFVATNVNVNAFSLQHSIDGGAAYTSGGKAMKVAGICPNIGAVLQIAKTAIEDAIVAGGTT